MVCVIPTANGRWTADSQHAVDGLRTLDCWLEPTWSRRHQHGEPSKFLKLWRSEIKPSYINRLAPLLRIHTAKSKRRRLGRRLCSAAGRASNARRCGLWTLDYRPHPFINKNHTTITWMIDWMLSMHPIPLRCWPRVQTQNSAKMMKTRWQMAAVLADGAAHRKKIKNVRNGNLVIIIIIWGYTGYGFLDARKVVSLEICVRSLEPSNFLAVGSTVGLTVVISFAYWISWSTFCKL